MADLYEIENRARSAIKNYSVVLPCLLPASGSDRLELFGDYLLAACVLLVSSKLGMTLQPQLCSEELEPVLTGMQERLKGPVEYFHFIRSIATGEGANSMSLNQISNLLGTLDQLVEATAQYVLESLQGRVKKVWPDLEQWAEKIEEKYLELNIKSEEIILDPGLAKIYLCRNGQKTYQADYVVIATYSLEHRIYLVGAASTAIPNWAQLMPVIGRPGEQTSLSATEAEEEAAACARILGADFFAPHALGQATAFLGLSQFTEVPQLQTLQIELQELAQGFERRPPGATIVSCLELVREIKQDEPIPGVSESNRQLAIQHLDKVTKILGEKHFLGWGRRSLSKQDIAYVQPELNKAAAAMIPVVE